MNNNLQLIEDTTADYLEQYFKLAFVGSTATTKLMQNQDISALFQEAQFALVGGKGQRGLDLVKCAGANNLQHALKFASALEVFQTSALVHDDIIDDDQMRRGRPASHVEIGREKAILLGDVLLCLADYIFNDASFTLLEECNNTAVIKSLAKTWQQMKQNVLLGQVMDVVQSEIDASSLTALPLTSLEELHNQAEVVAQYKTASYTTVAPYIIGITLHRGQPFDEIIASDVNVQKKVHDLLQAGIDFQFSNDFDGIEKDRNSNNASGGMIREALISKRRV
jgi:geranylgeranyl diphosphate synthase type I